MNFSIDNRAADKMKTLSRLTVAAGLLGIVVALSTGKIIFFLAILVSPIIIIALHTIINNPVVLLYVIFVFNYLVMGLSRYIELEGVSVVFDILLVCCLILSVIHGVIHRNINWSQSINVLNISLLCWAVYCILEVANPTAMLNAWLLSRLLIYGGLITSIAVACLVNDKKHIQHLLTLYSILSLLAVAKAVMQKYSGFDYGELAWLAKDGASTHLLATGARYFSFFTDAGNFGSNMGCAAVILTISSFYVKNKGLRIYYILAGALCFYALMLSGTRGAMIVPLGGVVLFVVISKNAKAISIGSISLFVIYVFFALTTIGQGNAEIRRMRTAFKPNDDPSFLVRKNNREKLGRYLKNKPFGEGLGLAGVENRKLSMRFTTSIPHDSWYVKIWVETGVIGLTLYLLMFVSIVAKCCHILMFKIKDLELKGMLGAMLCGVFGLMLSAYGNAFWGQFPTMIMAFMFLALIMKGEFFDMKPTTNKITN